MEPLTGKEVADRLQGVIQPKYQVHGYSVDLTVGQVYSLDPVGQVDFGGNEFVPAGRIAVSAQNRRPEDTYPWWDLARGCYFAEFNEILELAPDEIALLEPDERLLRAGAAHVPVFLRGRAAPIEALLRVDVLRLQIKKNARISHLRVFRFAPAEIPALATRATTPGRAKRPPKKARRK